jgi:hypothetical protein
MYFEDQYLPELYYMKHRNDSEGNNVDYGNNLLDKTLSPYIFGNNTMSGFLDLLKKPVVMLFDNFNIIKNFKNYTVDKYYYKHAK